MSELSLDTASAIVGAVEYVQKTLPELLPPAIVIDELIHDVSEVTVAYALTGDYPFVAPELNPRTGFRGQKWDIKLVAFHALDYLKDVRRAQLEDDILAWVRTHATQQLIYDDPDL